MTKGWLKSMLTDATIGQPVEPKPLHQGPPACPRYYLLASKPNARYGNKGPSTFQIADAKEELRLRQLRFASYASSVTLPKEATIERNDPLRTHDSRVDPAHVPKFGVFRKPVDLTETTFTCLSVIYGLDCVFVRPAFMNAAKELATDDIQFFPYECRLKSGEVFANLYLMHWTKTYPHPIDEEASGFAKAYSGIHRAQLIHNGQIVIKRSVLGDRPMQFCGSLEYTIFSSEMVEKIGNNLGKKQAFYPVHVNEDA